MREALLAKARLLLVPSPYESLSMVLLEAWNQGLPALVNGRCAVLHGQVLRANGGLSYRYASDFAASLAYLLAHPDVAERLGRQGLAYIEQEYRWPHVMRKVEDFLRENVAGPAAAPRILPGFTVSGTPGHRTADTSGVYSAAWPQPRSFPSPSEKPHASKRRRAARVP